MDFPSFLNPMKKLDLIDSLNFGPVFALSGY